MREKAMVKTGRWFMLPPAPEDSQQCARWFMLPPAPEDCQQCAIQHAPDQPHNQQSLFYRMKFRMDHGREPTWHDAMAHCPDEVQAIWIKELRLKGAIE